MQLYHRVYHLSTVTANLVQLNAGGYYVEQLVELVRARDAVRYSFLALISHIPITTFCSMAFFIQPASLNLIQICLRSWLMSSLGELTCFNLFNYLLSRLEGEDVQRLGRCKPIFSFASILIEFHRATDWILIGLCHHLIACRCNFSF